MFIASKASEVQARKIEGGLSGCEKLGLGSVRSRDERQDIEVCLLVGRQGLGERFWHPLLDELVDFL